MATAVSKAYHFPKPRPEKKPKQRYVESGGRLYMEKDYGWGATLVDPNAAGDAAKYKETAAKLLEAQGAEADARAANPDQALKAQYQEKELGAIAEMLGLKKRQGEAGITAMLGQLGLGEKRGGGMESVKGMSPELKAKLGIGTGDTMPTTESPTKRLSPGLDALDDVLKPGVSYSEPSTLMGSVGTNMTKPRTAVDPMAAFGEDYSALTPKIKPSEISAQYSKILESLKGNTEGAINELLSRRKKNIATDEGLDWEKIYRGMERMAGDYAPSKRELLYGNSPLWGR